MDKKMNPKMTSDEIFNEFNSLTEKTFGFLEKAGFQVEKQKPSGRESSVRYKRPGALISVNYEIGSGPWVTLTRENKGKWEDEYLKERFNGPDREFIKSGSPKFMEYSKSKVEMDLSIWAKALRESLSIG